MRIKVVYNFFSTLFLDSGENLALLLLFGLNSIGNNTSEKDFKSENV